MAPARRPVAGGDPARIDGRFGGRRARRSGASGGRWDLLRAAVATARFHSTVQASRAGYGGFPAGVPLHECISSFDNTGAMGFHWLNGGNLTTDLDPTKPQVLVYEPDRGGKLHLVALEFVVFKADWIAAHGDTTPSLFGEDFMDSGFPNRFDLPSSTRSTCGCGSPTRPGCSSRSTRTSRAAGRPGA